MRVSTSSAQPHGFPTDALYSAACLNLYMYAAGFVSGCDRDGPRRHYCRALAPIGSFTGLNEFKLSVTPSNGCPNPLNVSAYLYLIRNTPARSSTCQDDRWAALSDAANTRQSRSAPVKRETTISCIMIMATITAAIRLSAITMSRYDEHGCHQAAGPCPPRRLREHGQGRPRQPQTECQRKQRHGPYEERNERRYDSTAA